MTDPLYRPNPNVVATTLEDADCVLLDLTTRRYFTLNETGARIWQLLSDGRRVSEIAAVLTSEYEVSEKDAVNHVETLVSDLRNDGLVEDVSDENK